MSTIVKVEAFSPAKNDRYVRIYSRDKAINIETRNSEELSNLFRKLKGRSKAYFDAEPLGEDLKIKKEVDNQTW